MSDLGPACRRRAADQIVAGLSTRAAKIRALRQEGYASSEIAKCLKISAQYVQRVLARSAPQGTPEGLRVPVSPGGRIVIPAAYRRALGVEAGDEVLLRLEGDELRVMSPAAGIRRAQSLVARHVPSTISLVEELLAERRHETADEGL